VDSLRQPGGNTTGVAFGAQEARRLEWLIQVDSTIEQVYIIYNPEDQSPILALETLNETAPQLGVGLITRKASSLEQVMVAIESIPEKADAVYILPDSLVATRVSELVEAAIELQLPTSGAVVEDVKALGVLTSYGMRLTSIGKQAARLADQILQGIKPADLPVETAEFYSAINLETAKAIGLDIPDEVLRLADIIIR
jgi:putative ABC transport system substrate-binding protein